MQALRRDYPVMSGVPDWLDRTEYPFQLHTFSSTAGDLNYIDEGVGPIGIFLHGNPTWSFLYRNVIKSFSENFRCVAPDYPGFGLSDAPRNFSFTPEEHSIVITELIESLAAERINLVLHDWGGPIGLKYAVENPSRIGKIVLFNTWMWPVSQYPKFRLFSGILGSKRMLTIYYRVNLFARYVMPLGFSHPWKLSGVIHKHYTQPLDRIISRYATWMFPRALIRSGELLGNLWKNRNRLREIPKMLVWGMKDRMFDGVQLRTWMTTFPDAELLPVNYAGHYVPEEIKPSHIDTIAQFLDC